MCSFALAIQLEAIGKFLEGCRTYGVLEKDLCVSLDLHESCNKNMVCVYAIRLNDVSSLIMSCIAGYSIYI